MSNDRKIYKPKPVSGFPEWLPEERLVEQKWFDHIRRVFESYGFCSIETPSVEELDVLTAKGEVDKEIYVIERLHKDQNDKSEARLALHFDQTVPLARYVAAHFNDLVFPFKRYQMQRVWRGERPQAGRFREFYQCDIDVIGVDNLPLHFDAEMPAIMYEVMSYLPGMEDEKFQIQINNRNILLGLFPHGSYEPEDQTNLFRVLDKREKLSKDKFETELKETLSKFDNPQEAFEDLETLLSYRDNLVTLNVKEQIEYLKSIFTIHSSNENYGSINNLHKLKLPNSNFYKGLQDLITVMENLTHMPHGSIVVDFSIVRGLDYYTGTVYETRFVDDPAYGSICSGGRYDDLAGSYISKHLPGVGISIGFSRLFARMLEKKKLPVNQKSPADILMIMPSDDRRAEIAALCQKLRKRGVKVEMYHAAKKIPDQLKYADKKGIPYVWFPDTDGHKVKNMATQEQGPANPDEWTPNGKTLHAAA